jgi:hypothetical protein
LPARFSLGVRKTSPERRAAWADFAAIPIEFWSQWPPQLLDAQCTEEPEYDQDKQNGAKDAAKPGTAIAIIAVVTTSAAEQHDQQDDDNNCTHGAPTLLLVIFLTCILA